MSSVRNALAMASLEQYLGLLVNFIMIATMSRLLSPAEVGFAVVGTGLSTIIFSVREFATTEFLIQRPNIDEQHIRTSFTLLFFITVLLAVALVCASPALGRLYGSGDLHAFLVFSAFAALIDSFASPTIALLRRDMAFATVARIRIPGAILTAIVSVGFAYAGYGFVSVAIGALAGSALTTTLAVWARPKWRHFLPAISCRRDVLAFGCYKGATGVVDRIYESLPQLVLARLLPLSAVGTYNRANAVCGIPDRVLLSSVFAVAYPALSVALRQGQDMKQAYLGALRYITVVYWPSVLLLAILADPVVRVVLGPNWLSVVPLVQILSAASVFWFPAILTYPVLASLGANRDAFIANAIGRSTAATMLCTASQWGLTAMALSQFINLPFQMLVALGAVRRRIPFTLRELARALAPSVAVTLCAIAGPLAFVVYQQFRFDFSLLGGVIVSAVAGGGWLAGLALTRHPMLGEIDRVRAAALARMARRQVIRSAAAIADAGSAAKF